MDTKADALWFEAGAIPVYVIPLMYYVEGERRESKDVP
jgi:hypothetical protein